MLVLEVEEVEMEVKSNLLHVMVEASCFLHTAWQVWTLRGYSDVVLLAM